jgi:MoaA/NifB/PqqE/SkfB family radical SAM enzyme
MDNNNLIFVNKNMKYQAYSVESAHSLALNKWKGWYCSAGIRSIYIDFDGNIFRGTCGVGGWYGNVFNVTGFTNVGQLTSHTWIKCDKEMCSCGADMAVPKVIDNSLVLLKKQKETKGKYFNSNSTTTQNLRDSLKEEQTKSQTMAVFSKTVDLFRLVIWDLGRRCNFDCWYCSKNSHNYYEAHKNLGMLRTAYENLTKIWSKGDRTKFAFTGGEPTVYKDYLPFVQLLKSDNHIVHTTTNGSNNPKYYGELAEVSDIVFSIHLNYVEKLGLEKFLKAVQMAVETTEKGHHTDTIAKYNWVIVRIMLDPGHLELAQTVYKEFENFRKYKNFVLDVDLVHQVDNQNILHPYSKEELDWISLIHG